MQLKLSHRPVRRRRYLPVRQLLALALTLPLLLWGTQRQLKLWFTPAQAIVVLGGEIDRETFAARMAQKHQDLPVWVSSGTNPEYAEWVFFEEAGIARDRLRLDYRAVDTVTNFTTLVTDLKAAKIEKIYLITSDSHMRRSRIIGEIVLGSQGIVMEPVRVPSTMEDEPFNKSIRDCARALLWLATGNTGAEMGVELRDLGRRARQLL